MARYGRRVYLTGRILFAVLLYFFLRAQPWAVPQAGRIDSITPASALPGAQVTITGTGFGAKNARVTVGGKLAEIVSATGNRVTFVVPGGLPPGPTTVQLTNPGGQIGSLAFTISSSRQNRAPVANAGPSQMVAAGDTVMLDGGASTDPDGDPLTYLWSITSKPAGSAAEILNPNEKSTLFVADKAGEYGVRLTVSDGPLNNAANITVTAQPACPPGSTGNGTTCTACSPGTFSANGGTAACQACSPGTYSETSGATACTACQAGTFTSASGAQQCTACAPGNYSSTTGAQQCQACPAGTFTAVNGAQQCTACEPGSYSGTTGAQQCQACPAGTFTGANGAQQCSPCGPGSYSSTTGAIVCTACPAGTFTDANGALQCLPCQSGYTSTTGASVCTDIDECATNNGGCFVSADGQAKAACTNTPGSRSCGSCPAGYAGDGVTCSDINECVDPDKTNGGCDELTECTNTPGSRTCGPCPGGFTGSGVTGCVDIDECKIGNGGCDPLTACINVRGSFTCGDCPAGYQGTGETGCVDIDECQTGNGGCPANLACTNVPGSRVCGSVQLSNSGALSGVTATGWGTKGVAIGDMNGDGKPDLAVVNSHAGGPSSVSVFLNRTATTYGPLVFDPKLDFGTGRESSDVAVGDLNGDGRLDIVVANFGATDSGHLSVLLNTSLSAVGPLTFDSLFIDGVAAGGSPSIALADLNGDGRPDVITSAPANDAIAVYLNTLGAGGAPFDPLMLPGGGVQPWGVASRDLNSDGRADIIVANGALEGPGSLAVLRNITIDPGALAFAPPVAFATGIRPRIPVAADFNGDGLIDLGVTNEGSLTVSVLLNNGADGAVGFAPAAHYAVSDIPGGLASGDIDGDAQPDLVAAIGTDMTPAMGLTILRNLTMPGATTPSFGATVVLPDGVWPWAVAVGDVNGDGQQDIAVTNYISQNVVVFRNDGRLRLCETTNGGCDALTACVDSPGARTCGTCPSGYSGTGEGGCADVDECLVNNGGCGANEACTNTPGSRTCSAAPQSCADLAGQANGEYTLYFQRKLSQPFTAYCYDMDPGHIEHPADPTPYKTYLTLPFTTPDSGSCAQNISIVPPSPNTTGAGDSLCVRWRKVRFDPVTGRINVADARFTHTTGSLGALSSFPASGDGLAGSVGRYFGSAMACADSLTPAEQRYSSVDLRGLPFVIDMNGLVWFEAAPIPSLHPGFGPTYWSSLTGNSFDDTRTGALLPGILNYSAAIAAIADPDASGSNVHCATVAPRVAHPTEIIWGIQVAYAAVSVCAINHGGCDPLTACTDSATGAVCGACPAGYSGTGEGGCADLDECATNNGVCGEGAVCFNQPGTFACAPDQCAVNNGGCAADATCTNTLSGRSCACRNGFSGSGTTCTDINECQFPALSCGAGVTCTNLVGGFTCGDDHCPAGSVRQPDGTCADLNECVTDNGGCDPMTRCINTVGSRICTACPSGYTGTGATGCTDINECVTANGGCDPLAACTNLPGSRFCGVCPAGYTGTGITGCVDIDECLTDNGGCSAHSSCGNVLGGRTCGPCSNGFTGDGYSGCVDIDECAVDNGGCAPNQRCINLAPGKICVPADDEPEVPLTPAPASGGEPAPLAALIPSPPRVTRRGRHRMSVL